MERKVVLYIAMSLDGYIAREDGRIDWLPQAENKDFGFGEFYNTIDTVIIGRTTYEQIINELSPKVWAYEGKKCYVATTSNYENDQNVEFISNEIFEKVKKMKLEKGKDIWLVGGGKLIDQFIKQNLVDKYVITIIPTILGDGIPLFNKDNPQIGLSLVETNRIGDIVTLTYTNG